MVKLQIENEKREETYTIRLEKSEGDVNIIAEKQSTGGTQIIGYIDTDQEIHIDTSNAYGFVGA